MTPQTASQLVSAFFRRATQAWSEIADSLKRTFADCDDASFQTDYPATKFILGYMRELQEFHSAFEDLFQNTKRPPAADEFTAAVALALEQFLAARGFPKRVRSKESTHRKRGATRPDVSVWSNSDKLVATVNCKINLGWVWNEWRGECEKRADALRGLFPDCTSYLCVLTQSNWDTSELTSSPCYGKEWFCLYRLPPSRITDPVMDTAILTPIEPMFLGILQALKTESRLP